MHSVSNLFEFNIWVKKRNELGSKNLSFKIIFSTFQKFSNTIRKTKQKWKFSYKFKILGLPGRQQINKLFFIFPMAGKIYSFQLAEEINIY